MLGFIFKLLVFTLKGSFGACPYKAKRAGYPSYPKKASGCPFGGKSSGWSKKADCPVFAKMAECPYGSKLKDCPFIPQMKNCPTLLKGCPFFSKVINIHPFNQTNYSVKKTKTKSESNCFSQGEVVHSLTKKEASSQKEAVQPS
jgi:hypothetical protein